MGRSYKNGPQGRASVYLYQPFSAVYPFLWAPGITEMDGWSEALYEFAEPADRQLFSYAVVSLFLRLAH